MRHAIASAAAVVLATLVLLTATGLRADLIEGPQTTGAIAYAWATKKIDGAVWGMARGDVDGDGAAETILLERRRVRIGSLSADGFRQQLSCDLPNLAAGARVSALDLDGDRAEEIVVSAVEDGIPASAILGAKDGACSTLVANARWSLRVAPGIDGAPKLFGQGWSSDAFFFGPIREMRLDRGKLKEGEKQELPRGTRLFQFAFVPGGDAPRVALLKGYAPLEVRGWNGKKFKKVWRSPGRLGGSVNQLPASQRQVLGWEETQAVVFDQPPLAGDIAGQTMLVAVQSHVPAHNVVGRKSGVTGARVMGYAADAALGFVPKFETVELPSCVTEFLHVPAAAGGSGQLLATMQNECGMFTKGTESQVVAFDLPAAGR